MKRFFILFFSAITLLSACSHSGRKNFVGFWRCIGQCPYFKEITISENGDIFVLVGTGFSNAHVTTTYKYTDGVLKSTNPHWSDVAYGEKNKHIYFQGMEYEKAVVLISE